MEYIITTLFGIFIGVAVAGYMFINEINKKERKIADQKAKIENKNDLIDRQFNQIRKIKEEVNKHYYTVETLENKIKSVLSNGYQSLK